MGLKVLQISDLNHFHMNSIEFKSHPDQRSGGLLYKSKANLQTTIYYAVIKKYNLCKTLTSFSRFFILLFSSSVVICRTITIDSGLAINPKHKTN